MLTSFMKTWGNDGNGIIIQFQVQRCILCCDGKKNFKMRANGSCRVTYKIRLEHSALFVCVFFVFVFVVS